MSKVPLHQLERARICRVSSERTREEEQVTPTIDMLGPLTIDSRSTGHEITKPGPESGPSLFTFEVQVFKSFQIVPILLASGLERDLRQKVLC